MKTKGRLRAQSLQSLAPGKQLKVRWMMRLMSSIWNATTPPLLSDASILMSDLLQLLTEKANPLREKTNPLRQSLRQLRDWNPKSKRQPKKTQNRLKGKRCKKNFGKFLSSSVRRPSPQKQAPQNWRERESNKSSALSRQRA
jgi:hypothetical protein